ncbi:succinyl-diaminopimelate desuccinylase [Acaricomes phytoseiuli]|uniref:succinyl-diaminopimelate desuccinylase n=1 Tax=Acaricomes phytoseiuli TaxID=291968 RepID=UPI0003744ECA|nr:succinyl-diaminopimelate desuccinylase [Acaricomes phytoseiuli]MCW1249767.1 succinyl-diaminopimelate desuccinylase [Acaricomes phytoseiuli]
MPLDLSSDAASLTAALIDIESVSGGEERIADEIENALRALPWLSVLRDGDAILARTEFGLPDRILLAGHIDTVPLPATPGARGTVPAQWSGTPGQSVLYGRGAVDMKGGVAVQLALAAQADSASKDLTFVFYDHEEVEAVKSGLGRLARHHRQLLEADFGILLEPSNGLVEGGCNGTMRFEARIKGVAAHSARAWRGRNAIHDTAELLVRLRDYQPATVRVDGLDYREGLNAVRIRGGVAGNVIPDETVVEINYRFAPDKNLEQAEAVVREALTGFELQRTDAAPGARPGLDQPVAAAFLTAVGGVPQPKYGWTDVARLAELGIPAVNFGPGDPLLAHSDDEHVNAEQIGDCAEVLRRWLL